MNVSIYIVCKYWVLKIEDQMIISYQVRYNEFLA
ncbi:MAG: hypothetical protein ACI808_002756 [Paraglaciecola sp.]|jgi:hypothetical protein